ncbi:MAG: diguanylate cyclase [Burkholderiaceae bacterium]|nr:diguanylate cyclase [Burkholderiaceae bacterium]
MQFKPSDLVTPAGWHLGLSSMDEMVQRIGHGLRNWRRNGGFLLTGAPRADGPNWLADKVLGSTSQAVMVTDADGRIVAVNPAFTAMTGYSAAEVIGLSPSLQRSGRHDPLFYRELWANLHSTGHWQGEIWNRRKSGEVYPCLQTIDAIRDEAQRVSHYVALHSDISALKNAEERLSRLAHHDALTGLPNRLLFANGLALSIERAKRHRQRLAVLFLDLDHFKHVNDSLGHAAGDALLCEVGRRLRQSVRAQDAVARLSGDEFVVVLEEAGEASDVLRMADKIMATISQPVQVPGGTTQISASIGIALYPDDGDDVDQLLRAADAAMYIAKRRGRHQCAIHQPVAQGQGDVPVA